MKFLAWLEYNIHLCGQPDYGNIIDVLSDLVHPFVNSHRGSFNHWHYLLEGNVSGSTSSETRLRFEGTSRNLSQIRHDLINEINRFSRNTPTIMRHNKGTGSHRGCHGHRNRTYRGAASENFGRDWQSIADILQIGSESAIEILRLGRGLVENRSLQMGLRVVMHPYYLHLPANQLIVEP